MLLIVCVNLANLQLIRASTRAREISLRAALGANRARLAIAGDRREPDPVAHRRNSRRIARHVAVKALVSVLPISAAPHPCTSTRGCSAFSFAIAVLTGLLFGAPAALFGSRVNLQDALRARTESATARRFNARNALVVAELSLCIVLLAVAGLFTRSLVSLQHTETGFNPENVLTAEFRLPSAKYDDSTKVMLFMAAALERLRAIPGVQSVALIDAVPLSGNFGIVSMWPRDMRSQRRARSRRRRSRARAMDTFARCAFRSSQDAISIRTIGRGSERVAIVNRAFARKEWPGESAIGKSVRLIGPPDLVVRVVGVVGGVKQQTLSENDAPQLYLDKMQGSGIFASVAMRTVGDPESMGKALREAIWAVDPDQPVWKIRTIKALVLRDLAPTKFSVRSSSVRSPRSRSCSGSLACTA